MIERLTSDSRRAAPAAAFFAWPGEAADGRHYVAQAMERGCAAVLWESEGFAWNDGWKIPNAGVKDLKAQAGYLAHAFYGRPSESLWMCGITGTNGKTSCSHWLAHVLSLKEIRTGVIGTLGSGFPGSLGEHSNTTPDALEVHRWLAEFKSAGASAVAMEVSSHGLEQGRVHAVAFDCALFTNLTHDHLDYHGSMAAYGQAKARLFDMPGLQTAVLNLDDAFGVQLAQSLAARGVRTIGYGISSSGKFAGEAGKLAGESKEFLCASEPEAERIRIRSSWGEATASIPQLGRFNIANALGVLGCLLAKGIGFEEGVKLLETLPAIPGRMQRIGAQAGRPLVVVDFAHTPDALEQVLRSLRPVAQARGGRLVVVFGAGGGRDAAKRPVMGRVAAALADGVVLTSDNPRGEDPLAILEQIRSGIAGQCVLEVDRAQAIEAAIAAAADADVVLIAGKGHEHTQEIGARKQPFSDAAIADTALVRRGQR